MSYIGNEPIVSATRTVTEITATAGQTVFTANGGYTVGFIDVFVNGAQLQSADFTATDGSTVVLTQAAQVGDVVRLVAWGVFNATNIPSGSLTAGGITWSQSGGVTLPRIDSSNEGGQLNFNRASDNTATWSIDSFGNTSTPSLRFIDGANVRAVINGSGNVGIGTTNPTAQLQVFAQDNQANKALRVAFDGTYYSDITENALHCYNNPLTIETVNNFQMAFKTNATERMRITSGGVLCVGTTNEDSSRANIVHSGTPSRVLRVGAESGSFTGTMYEGYGARTTTNGTYKLIEVLNGNASGLFRVLDSGNAQNTNNSYGGTSDIKLKENIVDATPKLADLCKVKVRHYNFKSKPDEKQIGVVAQELEEVFAGLVEETADKDKDGNDLGTTTKSVKYSVFVPMLIKAIQELKTIVDNQKIELDNAKAEIELLKGAN